jgi:hypothetical protein
MAYTIEELRPLNPVLNISGIDFDISLITLNVDSHLRAKFGKLENIFPSFSKNPLTVFDALWILLLDKKFFDLKKKKMIEFIVDSGKTSEVSAGIARVIEESISKSMPIIQNKAAYDELMKIQAAANDTKNKPCYGVYYDAIGKRYGHTIEQFFELTLRQLHIMLTVIGDKSYEEIEIQAALQGRKLKERIKPLDMTEKEDKAQDDLAAANLKKLRAEYEAKKG